MKILFIKPSNSSFILQDENILKKSFSNVSSFLYVEKTTLTHLTSQLRLIFFLIFNIINVDLVYVWFAGHHSLLPTIFSRIFKKKSIIIIGGHDAAKVTELNYGAHRKKIRSWCVRKSTDFATILLPVSKFTEKNLFNFINIKNVKKTYVVYNGVDVNFFKKRPQLGKKKEAITVCGTSKVNILKLKGIDFFIKLSKSMPEFKFKIIGVSGEAREALGNDLPDNLEIYSKMTLSELINEYSKAMIICQFSRYEAFGMAVAEAMACECIPIAYNYGGLPEVVNGAGFLLPNLEINSAKKYIVYAFENYDRIASSVRKRIAYNFSKNMREKKIVDFVSNMVGSKQLNKKIIN